MYYIYHIPNVKIGCSTNPTERVLKQGYTDYDVLEVYDCIDTASDRELELQKEYGYKVDHMSYKKACKISSTTSPKKKKSSPINGIKGTEFMKKPILQLDLNNNLIKEYKGFREASRNTNINHTGIYRVLKGVQKTYKGFIWKYKD